MDPEHIHFVTGRLAANALRRTLESLAPRIGFQYSVDVLPITVAALMTPKWVARHIQVPAEADRVILPGYCQGDMQPLLDSISVPIRQGPRDLRDLPTFLGDRDPRRDDYGQFDIEILAEINHAPRLQLDELVSEALRLARNGADRIDLGCTPGETWTGIGDSVRALVGEGLCVSVDSWNAVEVEEAVRAGADLVLSVNGSNWRNALQWGCEVVVIPDDFATLGGLDETIAELARHDIPLRIDPILEPIGVGLFASLQRYAAVRERYPDAEMMMGIGNLTELTDVDSAGINVILLGICQELGVRSVLTTEVINWARSSVAECDRARRLVHHAVQHGIPPKHLEPALVMLRDTKLFANGPDALEALASQLKDPNYRIFAEDEQLHLMSAGMHLQGSDPFELFRQLEAQQPKNLDASHAFYLGYELAKAVTALTLGKMYRQDQALDWGLLTRPEREDAS